MFGVKRRMSVVVQSVGRKRLVIVLVFLALAMAAVFYVAQNQLSPLHDGSADNGRQDLLAVTEQLSGYLPNGKADDELQVLLKKELLPGLRQQARLIQDHQTQKYQILGLAALAAVLLAGLALLLTRAQPQVSAPQQQTLTDSELGFVDPAHIGDVLVSMDQGIVAWNRDCAVEIYNERVVELLDLPPGFMRVGLTLEQQIEHARARGDYGQASDDDIADIIRQHRNEVESTVDRMLSNGRSIRVNIRRRAGGGMVATYTDITELRKQTDRVRRQKAVVETILENLDQGVSLMDDDLTMVAFNRRYLELFGIAEDAVKPGDPLRKFCEIYADLGHYGEGDRVEQIEKRLEMARENKNESLRRHLRNGRSVDVYKAPLPTGGVVTTYRDVTERLRYEQDLEEARDKAEAASRSKSEFLANMSHEIRTPMNGVLGMAELLADTRLNEQQASYVKIILDSGSALLTIINDILDFSKIEAGKLELDPEAFNLRSAVEDVAILMANPAAEKGLELVVRFNPTIPDHVVGDAGRIRQIVTNLVGNAVKFTKEGHVLVEVDGILVEGRLQLKFSVEDTGIGLAEAELARIFDKFEQADNTTTRRYGGTGLGLAISKQLVELMGGEIGADSVSGEGSTFWFTLTLPLDAQAAAKRRPVPDLRGLRLLIVDDIEVNRKILAEQVENWGMAVKCVASAADALEALVAAGDRGLPYDLAILDYHMPEMDGEELARRIKENPATRDMALIMLSSVDGKGDARRFRQIGVATTLVKPARSSLLLESIAKVLPERAEAPAQPVVAPRRPATPRESREVQSVQQGSFNVILAEDNEINRYVVMQMLAGSACNLTIATNGKEAVELYESGAIDLILMDVSMPEMDGLEATSAIREIERQSGEAPVPIIGLTAHTMKGDRERCLAAGMDDYLPKPVQQADLKAMLARWLDLEEARRASGTG